MDLTRRELITMIRTQHVLWLLLLWPLTLAQQPCDSDSQTKACPTQAPAKQTIPPILKYLEEMAKKKLSNNTRKTVLLEGKPYYDVALEEGERLVLDADSGITRLTATSDNCTVRSLDLSSETTLKPEVFVNCNITKVKLSGEWSCGQTLEKLVQKDLELDINGVKCTNVLRIENELPKSYRGTEGVAVFAEKDNNNLCVDDHMCTLYVDGDNFWFTIKCENKSFTELQNVCKFPSNVSKLHLSHNKIRSSKKLFKYLSRPDLSNLTYLDVTYNQLDALPLLPPESFPKLLHIDFNNNNITKFDIEAIESFFKRQNFILSLTKNPWKCDCSAKDLMNLLDQHCYGYNKEENKSLCIDELNKLVCYTPLNRSDHLLRQMWLCNMRDQLQQQQQEQYSLLLPVVNTVLGLLNVVAFFFTIDLLRIRWWRLSTTPKLHHVVCWFRSRYNKLFSHDIGNYNIPTEQNITAVYGAPVQGEGR